MDLLKEAFTKHLDTYMGGRGGELKLPVLIFCTTIFYIYFLGLINAVAFFWGVGGGVITFSKYFSGFHRMMRRTAHTLITCCVREVLVSISLVSHSFWWLECAALPELVGL